MPDKGGRGGRGRQVVVTGFRREGDGTEIFRSTDTPSLGETLVYCFWVRSTRCTRYLLCLQRTTTRREGFNLDGCTMRGVKSGTEEGMGWMDDGFRDIGKIVNKS